MQGIKLIDSTAGKDNMIYYVLPDQPDATNYRILMEKS